MLDLNPFYSFIKQHALFDADDKVLLAVSGGRDSVLMSHYFKQANLDFGIAHCNFRLRGDEADAEEQFTSYLANELGVSFFTTSFDTTKYASDIGISIQMAARELRYNWLEEIRRDFGYDYIALAHHQSDTVETILLNLTRGTGISGLHGILPKRDKLIRPLLFHSRGEIDQIVSQQGLKYRDDSSNQSSKYARNKIRLQVVPALKELNPNLEETFKANARRFSELEQLLHHCVQELKVSLFMPQANGEILIPISNLKELVPQRTLLYGLLNPYNFTEPVIGDLIRALEGQAGKVFYSSTHQVIVDRKNLILNAKHHIGPAEILINDSPNDYCWNNETYRSYSVPVSAFKNKTSNNIVQIDHRLLIFPLKLRSWQQGDYFYPLGMNGKKKLSDYFIEQKIPRQQKVNIAVLENGNNEIVWIAGYRSDDRYKISSASEKIFILEKAEVECCQ